MIIHEGFPATEDILTDPGWGIAVSTTVGRRRHSCTFGTFGVLPISHDDAHSRSVLAEYVDGASKEAQTRVAYEDPGAKGGGGLADLLQRALAEKAKKGGGER